MILDRSVRFRYLENFPKITRGILETFKSHIENGIINLDEKAVHDIRVWSRRLTEVLSIGGTLIDRRAKQSIKALSRLRGCLGSLRDNHVQRSLAEEYGIEDLSALLESREKKHVLVASNCVSSFSTERLDGDFLHFERELIVVCKDFALLDQNICRLSSRIDTRFKAVQDAFQDSRPEDFDTLHTARITFKKLRYTLEALEEYTGLDKTVKGLLKKVQDRLGAIQDLTVLLQTVEKQISKGRVSPVPDITQRISVDRHMHVASFFSEFETELATIYHFIEQPSGPKKKEKEKSSNSKTGVREKYSDDTIEKIMLLAKEKGLSYRKVIDHIRENSELMKELSIESLPSYQTLARRAGDRKE